jgi:glucose-1-phosphate adenylyltransferase
MVTTEVEPGDAGRYGVVQLDGDRVADYVYKPDEPATNTISNEVFVFTPDEVLDRLDALADESEELEDLGHELLPQMVGDGLARAHRFGGYWRDVGTIGAFHAAHMEQLEHPPPVDLDDPQWPVLTHAAARRASARVLAGARVERSMLATAATIGGTVERSVIGRGAVIEEGAVVRDSVVLPGAVVRAGATVERAILDDLVHVERGVSVGEADGEIALVGLRAKVEQDVPASGRFPDVDDD